MSASINLAGKRFGRLTVLSYAGSIKNRSAWNCKCDCGNECVKIGKYLLNGDTKSCGCMIIDNSRAMGKGNRTKNKIEITGNVVKVFFNNSNSYFLCDLDDIDTVNLCTWYLSNRGYARGKVDGHDRLFHNIVFPVSDGMFCDHVYGDRLDNRKENLREATREQNAINRTKHKNNTSGVKGVSYHKITGKWAAYISINKQCINLGLYNNIEDAICARTLAERNMFGEYNRNECQN